MAVEYFGNTTPTGSFYGDTSGYWNYSQAYTCPGSGNYNLISLGIYARAGGGTPGNVRIAIYDSAKDFIAQGTAEITVNSTAQWWEHTTFILRGAGGSTSPVLTGGETYHVYYSRDSSDVQANYAVGASNSWGSAGDDLTNSDFPATDAAYGNTTTNYSTRVGVEAAAGGIDETLTDGITLADTPSAIATYDVLASDGVALSDSAAGIATLLASVSDGISLADTTSAVQTILATVADGIALADVDGATMTLDVLVADGVSVADATSAIATLLGTAVDGVTLDDGTTSGQTAVGLATMTVSVKQGTITLTGKMGQVTFSIKQPSVTFSA